MGGLSLCWQHWHRRVQIYGKHADIILELSQIPNHIPAKNEDDLKNENDLKSEDYLKNERPQKNDKLKNEEKLKNELNLKMETALHLAWTKMLLNQPFFWPNICFYAKKIGY